MCFVFWEADFLVVHRAPQLTHLVSLATWSLGKSSTKKFARLRFFDFGPKPYEDPVRDGVEALAPPEAALICGWAAK